MATTNLWNPVFRDGAFTSPDIDVRRFAIQKAMRAIDLGVELGAGIHVIWGGREGLASGAAKPPIDALDRYREAINFLCGYVLDQGYEIRLALEPGPNYPPGDAVLPTVGHALALIETLDHPEVVGVNPEVAPETTAGLSFYRAVAQAIWSGKLFHIDLNAPRIGRYVHDLRFGSEGIKDAFLLIKLLEESRYDGPRHFHARPDRVDDAAGIWDFAAGCMRTYLALAQKARRFADDYEIQDALKEAGVDDLKELTVGSYSSAKAGELKATTFDAETLASGGYRNERLDQLVVDLILGLR
jgi:xylose isomerase